MNINPKISILIPLYNTEKYVEQSVKSALEQTYANKEIIIINDGSTDKSLEKILKYEKNLKILNKNNGGTASALNYGMQNMTSELFLFLGADDIIDKNYVSNLILYNNKYKTNTNIICTNYKIINSDGKIMGKLKQKQISGKLTRQEQIQLYLNYMTAHLGTCLLDKKTISYCGGFNEKIKAWDFEFWLNLLLLRNIEIRYVNHYGYYSRWHDEQNSKNVDSDEISRIKKNIEMKLNNSNSQHENSIEKYKAKVQWTLSVLLKNKFYKITQLINKKQIKVVI